MVVGMVNKISKSTYTSVWIIQDTVNWFKGAINNFNVTCVR